MHPPLTLLACFSPILLRNSGTRKLCLTLSCTLEVLLSPLIPDSLPCLMDQVSLHIQWLTPKALHRFCIRNVFSRHFQLFPPNLSVLSFFTPSVFVVASCIVSLLQSLPLFGAFSHCPWGGIPKTYVWSWHFSPLNLLMVLCYLEEKVGLHSPSIWTSSMISPGIFPKESCIPVGNIQSYFFFLPLCIPLPIIASSCPLFFLVD